MNTKINVQTILIVFMVCMTVIVSTNSYANAQGGGEDKILLGNAPESEIMLDPVPGGPGFIMVNVYDFKPYDSTYSQAYDGTGLYNPSTTNDCGSVAGIILPHGATITKVTFYYYDNANLSLQFGLTRADSEGKVNTVAFVHSVGAQEAYQFVSQSNITYPIVDNQNYSYYLSVYIPPNRSTDLMLMNARIDYEYTSNLPAVMKN